MFLKTPRRHIAALICTTVLFSIAAPHKGHAQQDSAPNFKHFVSKSIYGQGGTLTTPNARHFKTGTISANIATLDPYIHYGFGVQLLDGLHAQLRQSAEISSAKDDAHRLFPGLDLKLRLLQESRVRPEISIGMMSAVGHKRMAGEYIAASKRYGDFDFTAGMGWGRFGSAKHVNNPFAVFGNHFDQKRPLDGEDASSPDDWFTGEDIGFFTSLVWNSPINGLSLSADYGADRYVSEQQVISGFHAPAAYSFSINYAPTEWLSLGVGMSGNDKIMGQLHLSTPVQDIKTRSAKRGERESLTNKIARKITGIDDLEIIKDTPPETFVTKTEYENNTKTIQLETAGQHETLPYIIGKAAQHQVDSSYASLDTIALEPLRYGLKGPKVKILTRDLDYAVNEHISSAEEIWHNAQISKKKFKAAKPTPLYRDDKSKFWSFTLENHVSLNEEDNGTLTRSALLVQRNYPLKRNFLSINRLRLNLFNNLEGLKYLRQSDPKIIRGNVEDFAANGMAFDQMAFVYNTTLKDNIYFAASAGYLEEMYLGAGAEILYRPFDKTWAIGAEFFDVIKRDPFTAGASGFEQGTATITGHVNAFYELPSTDTTISLSAGRFLAKDYGVSGKISHDFRNGARINGFVNATSKQDQDVFGGTTHLYGGLNVSVPLGSLRFLPNGSEVTLKTAPLGRNAAQRLDKPFDLFEQTEQLSRRHLIQNWGDIVAE